MKAIDNCNGDDLMVLLILMFYLIGAETSTRALELDGMR
jgi:hypothetical protein